MAPPGFPIESSWPRWIGRDWARDEAIEVGGEIVFVSSETLTRAGEMWRAREAASREQAGRAALARLVALAATSDEVECARVGRVLDAWASGAPATCLPKPTKPDAMDVAEHLSRVTAETRSHVAGLIRSTFFPEQTDFEQFLVGLVAEVWRTGGGR